MTNSPNEKEAPLFQINTTWGSKFAVALRGIAVGFRRERSFKVHLPVAVFVLGASAYFRITRIELCLLLVVIAAVIALELVNSSIETLAKAIDSRENEHLRDALDIASGAVLVVSIFALAVGVVVFAPYLFEKLWPSV